jgi:hypothetical protein
MKNGDAGDDVVQPDGHDGGGRRFGHVFDNLIRKGDGK